MIKNASVNHDLSHATFLMFFKFYFMFVRGYKESVIIFNLL